MEKSLIIYLIVTLSIAIIGSVFLLAFVIKHKKKMTLIESQPNDTITIEKKSQSVSDPEKEARKHKQTKIGMTLFIACFLSLWLFAFYMMGPPFFILAVCFIIFMLIIGRKPKKNQNDIQSKETNIPQPKLHGSPKMIFIPILTIWLLLAFLITIIKFMTSSISADALPDTSITALVAADLLVFAIYMAMIIDSIIKKRIIRHGQRTNCQITEVMHKHNRSSKGNRRRSYLSFYILCEGTNPVTGRTQTFKSPEFEINPEKYIEAHQITTMPVCFNPKGNRNIMDVSSIIPSRKIHPLF